MFIGTLGRYIKSKATPRASLSTTALEGQIVDKGYKHAKGVLKGVKQGYANYKRQQVISREYVPWVPKPPSKPVKAKSTSRSQPRSKKYLTKTYRKKW